MALANSLSSFCCACSLKAASRSLSRLAQATLSLSCAPGPGYIGEGDLVTRTAVQGMAVAHLSHRIWYTWLRRLTG